MMLQIMKSVGEMQTYNNTGNAAWQLAGRKLALMLTAGGH